MNARRIVSTIGPEGLVFGLAVVLALWNRPEHSVAQLIRVAPYVIGLGGLLLGWRLRRSRLVFALLEPEGWGLARWGLFDKWLGSEFGVLSGLEYGSTPSREFPLTRARRAPRAPLREVGPD